MIEGVIYALFPTGMQRMMAQTLALQPNMLRLGGLAVAVVGFWIVYFIRS